MQASSPPSLAGRTALITGATRGIGLATAAGLVRLGARVVVHGRDEARTADACRRLRERVPGAAVEGVIGDLGSLAGIRRLAAEVDARCDRLDVLINNAGLVTRRRQETADGLERQLAVNHLAPFVLTSLLLGKLEASAPARVVTVASMAHHRAAFDLDDLNWEKRRYSGIGAYGATKLANILFTRELARRLEGSGVTANCLHPGVVATNIFTGMGFLGTWFGIVTRPFMRSAERGAETSIHLAATEAGARTTGRFFSDCRPVEPAPAALDDAAARELWARSERLTGLSA